MAAIEAATACRKTDLFERRCRNVGVMLLADYDGRFSITPLKGNRTKYAMVTLNIKTRLAANDLAERQPRRRTKTVPRYLRLPVSFM